MSDQNLIDTFQELGISDRTKMIERSVIWVGDNNGSNYSGQIHLDLNQLSNSQKWNSYREAYLSLPYVLAVKSSTDVTATFTPSVVKNMLQLKDNFAASIIDSVLIECGGKTVQQSQNFSSAHIQWKFLTSFSTEDTLKNGSALGFIDQPSADAYTYASAKAVNGIGYINPKTSNSTAIDPVTTGAAFPTLTAADIINSGRSYSSNNGLAAAARIYYLVYMCQVRLRDISDFFDKCPLTKLSDIRITINYNSARTVMTSSATSTLNITDYQQTSGHICPYTWNGVISYPNVTYNTATPPVPVYVDGVYTPAGTYTIQSNVVKIPSGDAAVAPSLAHNNVRLYVPQYRIQDSVSLSMISAYPVTKFKHVDIFSYLIPSTGGSFNHCLTTAIQDPVYLVVIPVPKNVPSTDDSFKVTASTYQSIFDGCPCNNTSNIILSNFQVQLSGDNVFMSSENYDFEQFRNELSKINSVMGDNVTGVTSGILSFAQFQKCFRYYIADLSRRDQSQDNIVKSVTISGSYGGAGSIELICFIGYRRETSISTATGVLVE